MSDTNITTLRKAIYDAINMYRNQGRKDALKDYYVAAFNEYKAAGGQYDLDYFETTIDIYNIQGHCGY